MIQIVLSIYDKQAKLYLSPFFVPAIGVALRDISAQIARGGEDNQLALFTKDFELWQLALFDTETGELMVVNEVENERFPKKVLNLEQLTPRAD